MMPTDAVLAVTYRCNARCLMCGIWSGRQVRELPPAAYRNLPASLWSVNITGGEPFLRTDLADVVEAVRQACPRAELVISTNGLLTEKIVETLRRLDRGPARVGLAVSVDGIGDLHDEIRGVPGAFARVQATLRRLAESGITGVRLAFTATPRNVDHFERVYDLARQLGVEFTCALAQASDHYFQISDLGPAIPREDLLRHVAPVARAELASASPKRWARAYFMNGLLRFAAGKGRPLRCRAGRDFFFADPSGDVYPCNVLSPVMGNLAEQGFEEMWRSERVRRCRSQADACQGGCWMVCSARTAMRRRWPLVLAWALWHKVRPGQLG